MCYRGDKAIKMGNFMSTNPDQSDLPENGLDRYFVYFKWITIAAVVVRAALAFSGVYDDLATGDNDDIMRLMSVRAWMDGQSWFDMTQYRLLPPEGVSIHWSRYIDFGIALIIMGFATIADPTAAESAALVIWPSALMILMIWIVGEGTRKILGGMAGMVGIASIWLWGPTGATYFTPGRIDHHNVQILMMVLLCFAMIGPDRATYRGIIAGLAAAFSLAVGLESLLVIALVGVILTVSAAMSERDAQPVLGGFCITLALAATVFFVGQNHLDTWLVATCDTLSAPFLSIIYVAAAACLLPMVLTGILRTPAMRFGATILIAAVGLVLCRSLLEPCLDGPYGLLPLEVQHYITAAIFEALPGASLAAQQPKVFNAAFTPAIGATILASIMWLKQRDSDNMSTQLQSALAKMLCIGWLGIIAGFAQNRMIIMAAPAVPFLSGYVILVLYQYRRRYQTNGGTVALLAGAMATILSPGLASPAQRIVQAFNPSSEVSEPKAKSQDEVCQSVGELQVLNSVPSGNILTRINLGTTLSLTTHHNGLAAPYHRSGEAIGNGFLPFVRDEEGMKRAVLESGADYVLLCRNGNYGGPSNFAHALASGSSAEWLRPAPLASDALILLAVEVRL